MVKKGDTLIEVTIAIGIFSMIAITVASVMSSGTSGSQMALETTLAREEIDAQAEALRFIHSSYISSKRFEDTQNEYNDSVNPYRQIWGKIIRQSHQASEAEDLEDVVQFSPDNCDSLYDKTIDVTDSLFSQKAFILNLKQLSDPNEAVVVSNPNDDIFAPTTTYPRLVFGPSSEDNDDSEALASNQDFDSIYQAAGIYIVAVQDPGTTSVVGGSKTSAFYDFYIRTCWYGTDATRPSSISTVVRLYDPDVNLQSK